MQSDCAYGWQVEHEKVRLLEQQKDDMQFSLEEKVRKVDAAHSQILQDTLAAYDQCALPSTSFALPPLSCFSTCCFALQHTSSVSLHGLMCYCLHPGCIYLHILVSVLPLIYQQRSDAMLSDW